MAIRNYKSIEWCDQVLGPLTVLVGRNGAGKSNFLDAIRFVVDALLTSLDHALRDRGGIADVRRKSTGHPRNFSIQLRIELPRRREASYHFEIGAKTNGGFSIKRERVWVADADGNVSAAYDRRDGSLKEHSLKNPPPVSRDRLYLPNNAGFPGFREVYDAISGMGFYNLNPQAMKELHSPDAGELLLRDGRNIASVVGRLAAEEPGTADRIQTYLGTIVPGISKVERVSLGPKESLLFSQRVAGAKHPWSFYASSVSDGTLRALGALVAVTQLGAERTPATFVGIEEPETALHPAAAGALMDALREAAKHTHVAVTSHSPDLLDQIDPRHETLLVVSASEGTTRIARADAASLKAIQEHLYTPGELLRMDQLEPDPVEVAAQERQLSLVFGTKS